MKPVIPTVDACREQALRLLDHRAHSRLELRRKLLQRKWPVALVEEVLTALQAARLLDDRACAEAFVESRRDPGRAWGMNRIRSELRRRGIDEETAGTLTALPQDSAEADRELELATQAAARFLRLRRAGRRPKPDDDPYQARRREFAALFRHLAAKGYSPDTCHRAAEAAAPT